METDTASELKQTTKAINSIDKNLEQRFDEFKAKFYNKMVAFEKKVDSKTSPIEQFLRLEMGKKTNCRWKILRDL